MTKIEKTRYVMRHAAKRVNGIGEKHRLVVGGAFALVLAGLLAVMNVDAGPLRNLNDIGGWSNRALFIGMTAAAHFTLMMAAAWLCRKGTARLLLRQAIVTAGLYILLMAINQKTYIYKEVVQPIVRAMDVGGLAAGLAMESSLSAPATTLLYLITRGPVYDMYLAKLAAIFASLSLGVIACWAADRAEAGIRSEVVLALCAILPQGMMNAACCAQTDVIAAALLAGSLAIILYNKEESAAKRWAAAVLYGMAIAVSGAALYAVPVYIWLMMQKRFGGRELAAAIAMPVALCIPAMLCGMGAGEALSSLLRANLGLPAYASGAPNVMNIVPRAAVEEMPGWFMLGRLPEVDTVTNAQPFYTEAHYAQAVTGVTLAALAAYAGVCAYVYKNEKLDGAGKAFVLMLTALMACPGAASGAWMIADALCIYAIVMKPRLRLPACMALFATAGASCYPMTGEVLLTMILAFALCLAAVCIALGVISVGKTDAEE